MSCEVGVQTLRLRVVRGRAMSSWPHALRQLTDGMVPANGLVLGRLGTQTRSRQRQAEATASEGDHMPFPLDTETVPLITTN